MTAARARAVAFLFAPGAGAPSSSTWMRGFHERLLRIGPTQSFDYPYQRAGRRLPDPQRTLIAAHRSAFEELRATHEGPIVLVGKSMGGRVGCHLAVELGSSGPSAVVCLGYPLVGQNGKSRDAVLLELRTPVLFVQGTRDPLCPLERLAAVRAQMQAPSELCVVEEGDHSLLASRARLKADQTTQDAIDARILATLETFVGGYVKRGAVRH